MTQKAFSYPAQSPLLPPNDSNMFTQNQRYQLELERIKENTRIKIAEAKAKAKAMENVLKYQATLKFYAEYFSWKGDFSVKSQGIHL